MALKPASEKYSGVWINELKNGDIAYYINFRNESGKPVKKKVGVNTKQSRFTVKDAYDCLISTKHTLNTGQELPFKNIRKTIVTFGDVWNHYLEYIKTNKASWKEDNWLYNKHLKYLEKHDVKKLKSDDFEKLKQEKSKELSAQTVKHIIGLARHLLNYAIKKELVKDFTNPIANGKVEMPKIDNARQSFLSKEEAEQLLDILKIESTTAYLLSVFSLSTGARISEIGNLKWQDINEHTNTIYFKKTKNGNARHISISKRLKDALKTCKEMKKPGSMYVVYPERI